MLTPVPRYVFDQLVEQTLAPLELRRLRSREESEEAPGLGGRIVVLKVGCCKTVHESMHGVSKTLREAVKRARGEPS